MAYKKEYIVLRHRRSAYARSIAILLMFAFGVFIAPRLLAEHALSKSIGFRKIGRPKLAAIRPDFQDSATGRESMLALQQRLNVDTDQLIQDQSQMRRLRAASKDDSQPAGVHPFSSEHATRQKLVSELVLLLHLEKQDKSESTEIAAVRHEITRLQVELNEAYARTPTAPINVVRNQSIQLSSLREQYASDAAKVSFDQSEIAKFAEANQRSNKAPRILSGGMQVHTGQSEPLVANAQAWNGVRHTRLGLVSYIVVISVLLGLAFALLTLILRSRRTDPLCNAGMEVNFAGRAQFLGSIPRMKL